MANEQSSSICLTLCLGLAVAFGEARAETVEAADVQGAVAATLQNCASSVAGSQILLSAWQPINTSDSSAIWQTADVVSLPGNATSVLNVYDTIVQFREAPLFMVSREQGERKASAENVLLYRRTSVDRVFRRNRDRWQTKRYEAYRIYARRHAAARDAFEKGPGAGTVEARNAMQAAMHEWELRGYKTEVQSALSALASIDALDANALWGTRAAALSEAAIRGGGRPGVQFNPSSADWQNEDGWSTCGPLVQGGTTVRFDLKLISVRRDWLDQSVFLDRQWRWLESVPRGRAVPVSDGKGGGRLPLMPRTLVLVRRAVVEQAGGFRSETPGMTAIGWLGDALPLSPDPRPDLQWGAPQPVVTRRPFVTGVGIFVATALDGGTFDSMRAVGRHVVGPNAYLQFRFADWLMVGTAAGPHVGPGVAVAAKLPLPNERLELFAGARIGRSHDGFVQGLVGVAMPIWRSKAR